MMTTLKGFFTISFFHVALLAHCQIPCGIYSDAMRVIQIKEDLQTVEKSISMINKLSGKYDSQSLNQLNRWVTSKEQHAQNIQNIISQYFLTQRIKQSSKNYENELITLHQLLISVMKCKQSVDKINVLKSSELLDNFSEYYFDEHGIEHLRQLQSDF